MNAVDVSGVHGRWDPATRVAHFAFGAHARTNGADASAVAKTLAQWVGTDPFAILVDCTHASVVTLTWQLDWASVLRTYGPRASLCFYNADETTRSRIDTFRRQTPQVDIRVADDEREARSWATRQLATR